ncbi:hypothetical protein ACIBG5_26345 [Kribbella sp. NPDC050241]
MSRRPPARAKAAVLATTIAPVRLELEAGGDAVERTGWGGSDAVV